MAASAAALLACMSSFSSSSLLLPFLPLAPSTCIGSSFVSQGCEGADASCLPGVVGAGAPPGWNESSPSCSILITVCGFSAIANAPSLCFSSSKSWSGPSACVLASSSMSLLNALWAGAGPDSCPAAVEADGGGLASPGGCRGKGVLAARSRSSVACRSGLGAAAIENLLFSFLRCCLLCSVCCFRECDQRDPQAKGAVALVEQSDGSLLEESSFKNFSPNSIEWPSWTRRGAQVCGSDVVVTRMGRWLLLMLLVLCFC